VEEAADAAIGRLNGQTLLDRPVKVERSRAR
jgi:hypothetical protein